MDNFDVILNAKIEALGTTATPEQGADLVSWIIQYVPIPFWRCAAEHAFMIPGVYTEISMRLGEMGL